MVGWLNSDDLYYRRETVSEAVRAFQLHPEAGMVYADGLKITAGGMLIDWFHYPQYDLKDLLSFNVLLQPASFMRAGALKAAGYLPEGSNLLLDHELWLQLAARHPIIHLDGFWGVERSHESAKTISMAAHYGPDAFVLLEALKKDPLFAPTIQAHQAEILAGIHIFHARRLIDARLPREALRNFWQAARLHPKSAARVWFKIFQALAGLIGLGETVVSARNSIRSYKNQPRKLVVQPDGPLWVDS